MKQRRPNISSSSRTPLAGVGLVVLFILCLFIVLYVLIIVMRLLFG